MNFQLAKPQLLWLLPLIITPLVFFFIWAWRRRQELIAQFVTARLLSQLKVGVSPARQKARMAMVVGAVLFIILALARPQWGFVWEEVKQRGLDIMVAIDTSNSMLAEDAPPNRLRRAKLAAMDLLHRAKSDRLGLIAFAGDAYLECPLTLDDAAFSQSVDGLDTHTISQGGTALAEVIDTAVKAFKDAGENHKVLVIFTDGEDHEGEAVTRAEAAAKEGMHIFTVGIGSPEGEKLRVRDDRGRVEYVRDEQGEPVVSKLNEALLQQIAKAAGGFYLPLRGTKTMDTLYEQGLAPLPKASNSSKLLRRFNERFHWPLAAAILLLLVEMFLPDQKSRRVKKPATVASGVPATAAIALLLLLPVTSLWASSNKAYREYEAGKFEDSLKDYEKLLQKEKSDPRLHFNAGAAAYQSRKLAEATNQFNKALSAPDLKLQQQAYYNLGNTFYRMGEQAAENPTAAGPAGGAPGADPRIKAWEQAVQSFDSALKLNPQDEDAKYNQSFVKKQLEELKKQQQQQQQSKDDKKDKDKDKKEDKQKQDQQNQSENDSKKDDQQKSQQDQKQGSKSGDQKQDQQQSEQQKQDQQDQKQSQAQKKPADKKDPKDQSQQTPQQAAEAKKKEKEEADKEDAMMAAGQMTPQQAMQLLDAQKSDDEVLKMAPPNKNTSRSRIFKNW